MNDIRAEVVNPPYEPPKGGADVAPPVPPEPDPDPEVIDYIESSQLPPDPRDPPPEELPATELEPAREA
jgi:hypothetical protein